MIYSPLCEMFYSHSVGAFRFCRRFVTNPTDFTDLVNDPTVDATVLHHAMAINAVSYLVQSCELDKYLNFEFCMTFVS